MKEPLTTLQHVADELGLVVGEDGARDRVLKRYIQSASNALQELCGRNFEYDAAYEEDVSSDGGKYLVAHKGVPIEAITSIEYDNGQGSMETVDSDQYVLEDSEAGLIRHISGTWRDTQVYVNHIEPARMHGGQHAVYRITYEGGWNTPYQVAEGTGSGSGRTLPYDIEDAVIRYVVQKFKARKRDPNVSSMSVGSGSISYFDPNVQGSSGTPDAFESVVRRYKRGA